MTRLPKRATPLPLRHLAVVLGISLLAGCGSSKPAITASASATLVQQVAAVRAAAAAHDVAAAHDRLTQLRMTVTDLGKKGQLSAKRAAAILAGVDKVDTQLGTDTATTTTRAPVTTSTIAPPAPGNSGGHGHGHH